MNHERYGTRDLAYSQWHRLQGDHLAYIDIDSLEYCNICKRPLALIELAQDVGQQHKSTSVMKRLAFMSNLPAYLVLYKKPAVDASEILGFRVKQLLPFQAADFLIMTPIEYRSFLNQLRDEHLRQVHGKVTP